jgi:hypothetical protein
LITPRKIALLTLASILGLALAACGGRAREQGPPLADVGGAPALVEVIIDVDARRSPGSRHHCLKPPHEFLAQNYVVVARLRLRNGQYRRLPGQNYYPRVVAEDTVKGIRRYYVPAGVQSLLFEVRLQKRYSTGKPGKRLTYATCYHTLTKKEIIQRFKPSQVVVVRLTNRLRMPPPIRR